MKGTYILLIENSKDQKIKTGSLGAIHFPKGIYAYVGSAWNSLEARIARHRSKEKKLRWHIDYFLSAPGVRVLDVKTYQERRIECNLARKISKRARGLEGFGCSDCFCRSHLFYLGKI